MSCRFCARSSKGWNVAKLENCGDLRRNNSYQLSETEWRRAQYSNKPFHDACIWSMSQPPITPSFLVSKHLVQSCARSGTMGFFDHSMNETVNGATSNTLHDACTNKEFQNNKYQEHSNVRIWETVVTCVWFLGTCITSNTLHDACIGFFFQRISRKTNTKNIQMCSIGHSIRINTSQWLV